MLNIEERGSGGFPVLFLQGIPSSTKSFERIVQALAPTRRVLVADMPGYGRSPALSGEYTFDRVRTLIEDALLARNVESVDIIGTSGGCYRAFGIALNGRVRVRRFVGLGPLAGFSKEHAASLRDMAAQIRAKGPDFIREAHRQVLVHKDFAKAHPVEFAEIMTWADVAPPEVVAAECDACSTAEDYRPRLGKLETQVLLRVGADDVVTPVALVEEIARLAPHATVEVVPGCGHVLQYEDPDGTIASVRRFLGDGS